MHHTCVQTVFRNPPAVIVTQSTPHDGDVNQPSDATRSPSGGNPCFAVLGWGADCFQRCNCTGFSTPRGSIGQLGACEQAAKGGGAQRTQPAALDPGARMQASSACSLLWCMQAQTWQLKSTGGGGAGSRHNHSTVEADTGADIPR